jgi:hypothetical protein
LRVRSPSFCLTYEPCVGYPASLHLVRPFADYDLTSSATERRRREQFNYHLSSIRICAEHAFGRLKGRFPQLCGFEGWDIPSMYSQLEAVMIIHNILTTIEDDPAEILGYVGHEEQEAGEVEFEGNSRRQASHSITGDQLCHAGVARRKMLLENMDAVM